MTLNFLNTLTINGATQDNAQLKFFDKNTFSLNGSYSPSYQDITVSGNDYVSLPNAKANGLNYLKLYGGCEQRLLPEEYTQLEFIKTEETPGAYIELDLQPNENSIMEIKCSSTATSAQFMVATQSSSNLNYRIVKFTSGQKVGGSIGATNYSSTYDGSTPVTMRIDHKKVYANGELIGDGTDVTIASSYTKINLMRGVYSATAIYYSIGRIYYAYVSIDGVNPAFYGIPAERNSDNKVGLYDVVNNVFYPSGNSEKPFLAGFTATTPTPEVPQPIYCNNGELKVRNTSGLPWGYTKLETIRSNFTNAKTYITTDIYWDYSKDYRIKGSFSNPDNTTRKVIIGCYTSDVQPISSSLEIATLPTATNGAFRAYFAVESAPATPTNIFSNGAIPINTLCYYDFQYVASTGSVTITFQYGSTTKTATGTVPSNYTGISANPLRLFFDHRATSVIAYPISLGTHEIYVDGVLARKYVPCKNSSNVIGMYETVAGQFKGNEGTGSFTAGAIDDSIEVYTDGTVETVKAIGKNLLNVTWEQGAISSVPNSNYDANKVSLTTRIRTENEIYLDPNKTYTLSINNDDLEFCFQAFDNRDLLYQITDVSNVWGSTAKTFTGANAIAIALRYKTQDDILPSVGANANVQLEFGSTATTYKPYYNGGTATAQNLLAISTYKDVQSVLDGAITRNVGIKVLNGTETWSLYPSISGLFYSENAITNNKIGESVSGLDIMSNQYSATDDDSLTNNYSLRFQQSRSQQSGNDFIKYVSSHRLYIRNTDYSTAAEFAAHLASQYNSGNPVVIVYPLDTASTSSTTAQTLTLQEGSNTIEITQASITPLPLEANYKAGVSVTITEVENANLDNSVTVTIS